MQRRNALKWLAGAGFAALPAAVPSASAQQQRSRGLPDLKITDAKAILTAPPELPRTVVVEAETSEPGLHGSGCATFTHRAKAVVTAVDNFLRPCLKGKNPDHIKDICLERLADVMPEKTELCTPLQMVHVLRPAGAEVVQPDHLTSVRQQAVAKVRTDEPGCSRYRYNDSQALPAPAFIACGRAAAGGRAPSIAFPVRTGRTGGSTATVPEGAGCRNPSSTARTLANRSSRMVTFLGRVCFDLTVWPHWPITRQFPIDGDGSQACSSGH